MTNKLEDYAAQAKRYRVGQSVRIQPWTDSFMQGFTHGRVTSTRGAVVYVQWDQNSRVKRGFHVSKIEPA